MAQRIAPRTNPTQEQLESMATETKRLTNTFGFTPLSKLTKIPISTISGWAAKGMVSAEAAIILCQYDEIKAEGFTKESLRPDVKIWY